MSDSMGDSMSDSMSDGSENKTQDDGNDVYRNYFDEMPVLLTIHDRDLKILDSNRHFRDRFGDATGKFCWEAYKGRNQICPQCVIEETFLTGKKLSSEETFIDMTGREIPVIVRTTPILDSAGKVRRVLQVSTNIYEVKKLQKKLHKTKSHLQQLFNEVPCYITVQDRDFKITDANRRFKEDFGEDHDPHCFKAYKHRSEPCLMCPGAQTFEDGKSHRSEEVVTSISGDQHNVLVQTAPLRNAVGEISHVVEMSTNITELRQLQDQLTSLGLLVGSISHNIKGVLAALDGGVYIVNSGMKRNDNVRVEEGWDIVQRNLCQVRNMVLDILYYAKDRELEFSPLDTVPFAEEVFSKMQYKADDLDIELEKDFNPDAGDLEADENSLRAALINILENALDACRVDKNKDKHRVSFGVSGENDHVVFTVLDNGIGMDRETREKVFSLFFSSKGTEGTGLGLFISNKIVQEHKGRVEVNSTLNVGTRFTVRIPRLQEEAEEAA